MDRRRAAIEMSPAIEDDDRARKRRKQSDESSSPQAVFEAIWNHKERNRNIRQHFEELPSKEDWPDYYVKITSPISLFEIKNKLDNEEYPSVADIQKDLSHMIQNATIYNKAKSQIHSDALRLRTVVESFNVGGGDEPNGKIKREPESHSRTPRGSRAGPSAIKEAQLQVVDDLLAYTDVVGEPVSYHFRTLPPRKAYPDYYQIIKQPISLNQIRSRVKEGLYRTWAEFEEAVALIRKNAETYNDEGSDIVKDARTLEAYFTQRLQKEKVKLGDQPSGIKLRFNVGGRQTPAQPLAQTPASSGPKIRLNMGKQAQSTPTLVSHTNGVTNNVPPKPPVDRRSPLPKKAPVAVPAPVSTPAPAPKATQSHPVPAPNHIAPQQPPAMKRSESATSPAPPTPMTGIVNGTNGLTHDTIVLNKPQSLTPQPHVSPPVNASMPPPNQRLSTTPRPSYSPIPSMASPVPAPAPVQRSLYQYDEPRFRPEGKDASSALIRSLCIASTSALDPDNKYSKKLEPDDKKVTSQFYLHLPAEFHTISATPTLSTELTGKLYRLSIDVKFSNSAPKTTPMTNQKKDEPQFDNIRLVPGVVNTLECTAVTEARRDGAMAGWELERYRVFIMLLPQ